MPCSSLLVSRYHMKSDTQIRMLMAYAAMQSRQARPRYIRIDPRATSAMMEAAATGTWTAKHGAWHSSPEMTATAAVAIKKRYAIRPYPAMGKPKSTEKPERLNTAQGFTRPALHEASP